MPPDVPRGGRAAYRGGELLAQALVNHRPPRHEAEALAIVEHGVAAAGKHDATAVDARHALAVGRRAVGQAGFGGEVLGGMRHVPPAQGCQQVARQNDALAASLGQPLFGQEVGALL